MTDPKHLQEPYYFVQTASGQWAVQRHTFTLHESTNTYEGVTELYGTYPRPQDAIDVCMDLNAEFCPVNPLDALQHLYALASTETSSGAEVAALVLLGLYNGPRFPFDLTELRRLDKRNHQCAMALIWFDTTYKYMEVHDWLNNLANSHEFGERFEELAHRFNHPNAGTQENRRKDIALAVLSSPFAD